MARKSKTTTNGAVGAPLDRLNPRQREAVESCAGPVLVIAGPGTGKTRVITEKVLYLIADQGYRPESILALTFTEKAASEMIDRIRGRLAEAGIHGQPVVNTFHGFCFNLVQEFADRLGFRAPLRLLVGPLYVQFVADQVDHLVTENTDLVEHVTQFATTLADFTSRCHDEGLIGQDLVARVDGWLGTLAKRDRAAAMDVRDLAASLPRLLQRQYANQVVTYGDLLTLAERLLRDNDDLRQLLQTRYQYILVDELQDNNTTQFQLVNALAEQHRRVLVVGDEDQCIYRFRGAGLGLVEKFQQHWEQSQKPGFSEKPGFSTLKIIPLEENYRSTPAIISTCQSLIAHNTHRFEGKVLRRADASDVTGPERVVLSHLEADDLERHFLVHQVIDRIKDGRKPGDLAILCRSLPHVAGLVTDLRQAGIAVEVVGEGGLFSNPVVRELLAWLRILDNPGEEEVALHRVLRLQGFGLTHADQHALGRAAKAAKVPAMTLVESLGEDNAIIPGLSAKGTERLLAFRVIHERFRTEQRAQTRPDLVGLLWALIDFVGLRGRLRLTTAQGRQDHAAVAGLLKVAESYQEHYPTPDLRGYLRFLKLLDEVGHDETAGTPTTDQTTVKVMTIHQAKGREFPVVIVGGLSDRFPSQNRREWHRKFLDHLTLHGEAIDTVHQEEERRVLYVALSRAREELLLSAYDRRGGQPLSRSSPFLPELQSAGSVQTERIPSEQVTAIVPAADALRTRQAIEARLHYLISRLGFHMHGPNVRETLEEGLRLFFGLVAVGTPNGEAVVREVLAEMGLPWDGELPLPEPDLLVGVNGPLTLSASSLECFDECPRQYYYRHVVGIPQTVSFEARLGTAIHGALEEFHRRHRGVADSDLPELIDLFESEVTRVEFRNESEKAQGLARGRGILTQYVHEEAKRAATIAAVHVEKEMLLSLGSQVTLITKVDRIDELTDGRARIVDYKTGKLESRPFYLKGFQMPAYAWAVQQALGKEVESVEVIGLKALHEDTKGIRVHRQVLPWNDDSEHALTPERLSELREQVAEIVQAIRSGRFDAKPSERNCQWCSYRLLCDKAWGTTE